MSITRRTMRRSLLLAVLLSTGGCSKLDKVFGDKPGMSLPHVPFSLECRLHSSYIGGSNPEGGENPAWLRIQLNPKGGFYKIVDYGGGLPDYRRIYQTTESDPKNNRPDKRATTFEEGANIPFVGNVYESTFEFRLNSNSSIVILAEHNDLWFRDGAIGGKGTAIPYMSLDVKERTLNIRYEWRDNFKTYADYQQHPAFLGGPVSFKFNCARSPKDTVIEVNGFDQ